MNEVYRINCDLNLEIGPRENKPPLPEYILHGNSTYRILQKKITWYEALRECKQNGSDLVSIHSESHQVFLDDIVKRDGYPLWIGLSSLDVSFHCHDHCFFFCSNFLQLISKIFVIFPSSFRGLNFMLEDYLLSFSPTTKNIC